MKKFIRAVCVTLVIALIMAVPVSAEEEVAPCSSAYFASISTYLYKLSTLRFAVCFDVIATRPMDELGVSSIEVQRSSDSVNWTTMKTYTPDEYQEMVDTETGSCDGDVAYTGTPGYYYRAYVTFYAKDGNNLGEMYRYTDVLRL